MICKEDYLSFAIGGRDYFFWSRNYAVAKLDAVKGNTKDRHDDASKMRGFWKMRGWHIFMATNTSNNQSEKSPNSMNSEKLKNVKLKNQNFVGYK